LKEAVAEEQNEVVREKAKTSITVSALMIAAAAVVFSVTSDKYIFLKSNGLYMENFSFDWASTVLMLSGFLSLTAFVLFVVTMDVLDTLLNKFAVGRQVDATNYFYGYTSNPKYIGMLCLVMSVCTLVSYHSAGLAAYGLGLFLAVGYRYWFPEFILPSREGLQRVSHILLQGLRGLLIVAPLIVMIVDLL
jgi:protein-S-isoprenylcysteine O-methyltransferase Ste14